MLLDFGVDLKLASQLWGSAGKARHAKCQRPECPLKPTAKIVDGDPVQVVFSDAWRVCLIDEHLNPLEDEPPFTLTRYTTHSKG